MKCLWVEEESFAILTAKKVGESRDVMDSGKFLLQWFFQMLLLNF